MKIHYFQRYHEKENVATANAMLLLSRLYTYSPEKLFMFIRDILPEDVDFDPEIIFKIQDKSVDSVPDATITQNSFKIIVETKTSDWFHADQMINHLKAFSDEKCKLFISLSPTLWMEDDDKRKFIAFLESTNKGSAAPILYVDISFAQLIDSIQSLIDDRDWEMQSILDDYREYCIADGLINDSWNKMMVYASTSTKAYNMSQKIYWRKAENSSVDFDYLGLYAKKEIYAVGRILSVALVEADYSAPVISPVIGTLTDTQKATITKAINDYHLVPGNNYRFFFVDDFSSTDIKKTSKYAIQQNKRITLSDYIDDLDPKTPLDSAKLADYLKGTTI